MTLHQDSNELLAAIPRAIDGVAVTVFDDDGAATRYGDAIAPSASVRADLPVGAVEAAVPAACPEVQSLVQSLLGVVKERERLEADMESMTGRSLGLMEQLATYRDTLQRIAGLETDAAIADEAVTACRPATGARHVVYLEYTADKGMCEVVAEHGDLVPHGSGLLEPFLPVEGFLAEVVEATTDAVVKTTARGRLGEPGSVEALAEHAIVGVPVTYSSGDKLVTLGVLALIDRVDGDAADRGGFGSWEIDFAFAFAGMLGAIRGARKTAELRKGVSMARTIQRQVLPEQPVAVAGYDVAACYEACGSVGGDYFEYANLADGRTLVAIADVSGHDMASGMLMVGARSTLRAMASVHRDLGATFSSMAALLYGDLQRTERFLTAAALALRAGDGRIEYVCAGHNDLMVYRAASDRVERVVSDGVILGFVPDVQYVAMELQLQPGDCALLYTDGITEAVDAAGAMFGEERLAAVFAQLAHNRGAQRIVAGLAAELDGFRGGAAAADDVTAVVIQRLDRQQGTTP